jgi:galactonate dehydratase
MLHRIATPAPTPAPPPVTDPLLPARRDLRIRSLELFPVPPRWLFLKITTEGGVEGWGEPVVEGRAATVRTAVEEMAEYLVGRDASRIEDHWQTLYRGGFYRGGPILMSALAGIDQALWDIRGKSLGVPVHELLGGPVRERMRVYGWIGGDAPEHAADAARERVAAGFRAVKMNASGAMGWIDTPRAVDAMVERVASVREAVGPAVGIGVDFHGRVRRGMAKVLLRELEPLRPMFVEEVVLPENNDALAVLQGYTTIPIATGERMYSRWDFKTILQQGVVDIVQPDPSHAGGISEVRRIAAMAEAYDVALAPHCPLGPVSLAAALQIDFCSPNAVIQESSLGIHYNEGADLLDYLREPAVFDVRDGYVARLTAPGLGIEVDEERVRHMARQGHAWRNPVWRDPDGSVVEW